MLLVHCTRHGKVTRHDTYRLACTLLLGCGRYFLKGRARRRLDTYLLYLQVCVRWLSRRPSVRLWIDCVQAIGACIVANTPHSGMCSPRPSRCRWTSSTSCQTCGRWWASPLPSGTRRTRQRPLQWPSTSEQRRLPWCDAAGQCPVGWALTPCPPCMVAWFLMSRHSTSVTPAGLVCAHGPGERQRPGAPCCSAVL